jgi:hypothetical protein
VTGLGLQMALNPKRRCFSANSLSPAFACFLILASSLSDFISFLVMRVVLSFGAS